MGCSDTATAACGYWRRRGLGTQPEQVVVAPGAPLLLLALLAATGDGASRNRGAPPVAVPPGHAPGPSGPVAPDPGPSGPASPDPAAAPWPAAEAAGAAEYVTAARHPRTPARGDVLLPCPTADWHAAQAGLLSRQAHPVSVPAECGGIPDPVALQETVRRIRTHGGAPRVLLLSVADDPTGTIASPELLHEVCQIAVHENLLIISDESWRDTAHDPRETVVVSPAEMLGRGRRDSVIVLVGLEESLLPDGPQAGIARFPASAYGRRLSDRVREILHTLQVGPHGADDIAVAAALAEPAAVRQRRAVESAARGARAAALHTVLAEVGALCRPPQVGRHLYADLEQRRPRLEARGVTDAAGLEAELVRRLGPYVSGGHRLGDEPGGLRARLSSDVLRTPGTDVPREAAVQRVRAELAELLEDDVPGET